MPANAIHLYLIDDDPLILRFVQETLRRRPDWSLSGYSDSLSHALKCAVPSRADVFLVDLGLPDGDGEELLRELVLHRPDAELLVFTVFGDESRLIRALESGATGYVLKGCSADQLIAAIEQIQEGGAPISPLLARMLLKKFQRTSPASPAPTSSAVVLSDRETDVLKLVAQGYVSREISTKLGIGSATVNTHIKNLYRKLAVHSRVAVVKAAKEHGLI